MIDRSHPITLSITSSEIFISSIFLTRDFAILSTFLSFERTLMLPFQLESNEEEEVIPLLPLPASLMWRIGFNGKIVECKG